MTVRSARTRTRRPAPAATAWRPGRRDSAHAAPKAARPARARSATGMSRPGTRTFWSGGSTEPRGLIERQVRAEGQEDRDEGRDSEEHRQGAPPTRQPDEPGQGEHRGEPAEVDEGLARRRMPAIQEVVPLRGVRRHVLERARLAEHRAFDDGKPNGEAGPDGGQRRPERPGERDAAEPDDRVPETER